MKAMRILIIGGTGMLGHILFTRLSSHQGLDVYATARNSLNIERWFSSDLAKKVITTVDVEIYDTVVRCIATIKPDVVINCAVLINKLQIANDPLSAITINSLLPHRISLLCKTGNARMIHISTDGVFDGSKGGYKEDDAVNISDIYGMTKYLGEISNHHCLTLRTSIIGHELKNKIGLVDWFLSQKEKVRAYTKAIYSGLPTIELAEIICDYVLPRDNLCGIYHVSSDPISKFELLHLIAERYGKIIKMEPFDEVVIDRSLNSSAFQTITGYIPPSWPELVNKMYLDYIKYKGRMYV